MPKRSPGGDFMEGEKIELLADVAVIAIVALFLAVHTNILYYNSISRRSFGGRDPDREARRGYSSCTLSQTSLNSPFRRDIRQFIRTALFSFQMSGARERVSEKAMTSIASERSSIFAKSIG